MHFGLDHKEYHHNQGWDEQKLYTMWIKPEIISYQTKLVVHVY